MTTASNWLDDYFGPGSVQDESTDLPKRPVVAFVGGSVAAADDPTNKRTVVTIAPNTLGPDGSGNANITAPVHNTSNPKVTAHEYNINASNPTTAATTVLTIPTVTGKTYSIRGIVAMANSPGSAYGEFEINAFAVNNAGAVTLPSNTTTQKANVTGFVVALSVSGTNLIIQVTDPGPNRRITGAIYVAERTF